MKTDRANMVVTGFATKGQRGRLAARLLLGRKRAVRASSERTSAFPLTDPDSGLSACGPIAAAGNYLNERPVAQSKIYAGNDRLWISATFFGATAHANPGLIFIGSQDGGLARKQDQISKRAGLTR